MGIPGMGLLNKGQHKAQDAEQQVNKVTVPMTRRIGLVDFVKRLFSQMGDDHLGAFAGNLAYQAIFAIFPFLVFMLSLLGLFHATSLLNTLIDQAAKAMPADAVSLLRKINYSITKSHTTGAFTVGAIISILAALWGVSGGFRAVMEAMNVMYNVKDERPFWKKYLISILLSVAVTALLITALVLVVFGPAIGGALADYLGLGAAFRWTWNIVQWPILLAFVLFAFALVYYFAPDAKQSFRFVSPGAIAALVAWVGFSLLFSLYVSNFSSYNKTYGTLAGAAVFLLYMYYSAFILLVGAEINQIVEEHAPGGKDPGEKVSGEHDQNGSGSSHPSTLEVLRENRLEDGSAVQVVTESRPRSLRS